jgi:hypothetical protein
MMHACTSSERAIASGGYREYQAGGEDSSIE